MGIYYPAPSIDINWIPPPFRHNHFFPLVTLYRSILGSGIHLRSFLSRLVNRVPYFSVGFTTPHTLSFLGVFFTKLYPAL